ncbi:MAG: hypothetical protein H6625_09715 [Bdellovibrionaceae bacterium]|nr:hypothetical protein [Pseudobdellovibrionaceae bacterium]
MVETTTEKEIQNSQSERIHFILLVIGFIALAMVSQQQENESSKTKQVLAQSDNSTLICAQRK